MRIARGVVTFIVFLCCSHCMSMAQTTQPESPGGESAPARPQLSEADILQEAQTRRDNGQLAQARALLRELIKLNEKNTLALVMDGEIALELLPPDLTGAKTAFTAALRIQPSDFRANYGLGRVQYVYSQWRNALLYFENAAKAVPADRVAELYARMANCYAKSGDLQKAFESADRALSAAPDELEPHEVYVSLLVRSRNYEKALTAADKMIELATQAVPSAKSKKDALTKLSATYGVKLEVLQKLGEGNFAIGSDGSPTDKPVPGREKTAAQIVRQVADTYILVADLNRTLTHFTTLEFAERAANIDHTNPDYWLLVGMLRRSTYQDDKAAEAFQKVLELDPTNDRARRELESLGAPTSRPASQPAGEAMIP